MRARLLLGALVLALIGAACGGGDDKASTDTTEADSSTTNDTADAGSGDVDCAAIHEATQGLGLAIQILAQLKTLEQYALVKDGTLTFDAAATLEDIDTLRALEGVDIPAGYGTMKESLDTYEEAAALAQENLAVDDPFADAKGDELVALTENTADFISHQMTIGFALDGAGC